MPWIPVHQSLPRHRKTIVAAEALGVPPVQVVGHVVSLWLWALDNTQDGELPTVTSRGLALAAEWPGDAEVFTGALVSAGFVDARPSGYAIHDWEEYSGRYAEQRERHNQRQRNYRARHPKADDPVAVTSPLPLWHDDVLENMIEDNITVTQPTAATCQPHIRHGDGHAGEEAPAAYREDRAMFAALCRGLGVAPPSETSRWDEHTRGRWNAQIKKLRALGCCAERVPALIVNYTLRFGIGPATPNALVTHWAEIQAPPPALDRRARARGATGTNGAAGGPRAFADIPLDWIELGDPGPTDDA